MPCGVLIWVGIGASNDLLTFQHQTVTRTNADLCRCNGDLTYWGRVKHLCISELTVSDSDNGLVPGRHQAIIWTNAGILLIWTLGTNFSEAFNEIHTFSFKKMQLKMSAKWWQFCLSLNVLSRDCKQCKAKELSHEWFLWCWQDLQQKYILKHLTEREGPTNLAPHGRQHF